MYGGKTQLSGGLILEYVVRLMWDSEANVWIATNDEIPICLESETLDRLMQRVKLAAQELIEMNHLPKSRHLLFQTESGEEILA